MPATRASIPRAPLAVVALAGLLGCGATSDTSASTTDTSVDTTDTATDTASDTASDTSTGTADTATETAETADTATETSDTATDTAEGPCPAGMVIVGEGTADAYCIHLGEVHLLAGTPGDADQHLPGAVGAADVALEAGVGVMPSWALSYDQALSICQAAGMDLPTWDQWEDAEDGVVGDGGTLYSYGQDYDPAACATQDDPEAATGPFPTGTWPGCVSPFGVYDGLGNLWEWYHSGQYADVAAWFEHVPATFGVDVTSEVVDGRPALSDERVLVAAADRGAFSVSLQGVTMTAVTPPDGVDPVPFQYVVTAMEPFIPDPAVGLLFVTSGELSGENVLPVELAFEDADPSVATLYIARTYDGAELPGKTGGAFYTPPTSVHGPSIGHSWSFNGTIGFRCVTPPSAP